MNFTVIPQCVIIQENLDWTLYPILIVIILAYILFDNYYYVHVTKRKYKQMQDVWETVNKPPDKEDMQ